MLSTTIRILPTVCVAGIVLAAAAFATDHDVGKAAPSEWSSFRSTPSLAGVAAADFTAKPELLWTYDAGAPVSATAAIVGSRVFTATESGELIALNLADGREIWKFSAEAAISASPCIVDGVVFLGDSHGYFYAVDADSGKQLWRYATDGKIESSATPGPGGTLLVGSYDSHLYCFEMTTGKVRWKYEIPAPVHCTPCVVDSWAVIAGCDGKIHVIDLETGNRRHAADIQTNFAAGPAYSNGQVYVGSMNGDYIAMNITDGSFWRFEINNAGPSYAGAAVTANSVVFATRGRQVLCFDLPTKKLRWEFATRARVDSSPAIAGNAVIVGSGEGNLYALNYADGALLWQFAAGAEITASPAITQHGMLVIAAKDGAVYCFKAVP